LFSKWSHLLPPFLSNKPGTDLEYFAAAVGGKNFGRLGGTWRSFSQSEKGMQ
jgi:hypothetical protein